MKNVDERIGKCSGKAQHLKQSRKAQRRRSAGMVGQEAPGRTVSAAEKAIEGPFGDHTGYYNAAERYPVFRLNRICVWDRAEYLTTFTGRAPDEPSVLGEVLAEIFKPLVRQQLPEGCRRIVFLQDCRDRQEVSRSGPPRDDGFLVAAAPVFPLVAGCDVGGCHEDGPLRAI